MFYKTANTPILGVYQSSGKFHKLASKTADLTPEEDAAVKHSLNIISKDVIRAVSKVYALSSNIDDYIFPIPRAVTAGTQENPRPNNNGDNFDHDELTRFSSAHKCLVYETFKNDPLHVEHVAFDPKAARGFLPDVYYVTQNPEDMHVIAVAAVDTTKDYPLAEAIIGGKSNAFSMGCQCDAVRCSHCGKTAYSDNDLCECLTHYKMADLGSGPIYEDCLGVEFQELSVVGNPADPTALTQRMLQRAAMRKSAAYNSGQDVIRAVNTLLSREDQIEAARYFKANMSKMPESVIKLIAKLF